VLEPPVFAVAHKQERPSATYTSPSGPTATAVGLYASSLSYLPDSTGGPLMD
jgi:hypothetical protein